MRWGTWVSQLRAAAGIAHGSRAFGGPYQASFSLSNRCNLRCIHCYFYSPLADRPNLFEVRNARRKQAALPDPAYLRSQQRLDADTPKTAALMDELLRMGTRRFHFSGSGEPFLHPNILDFLGRAKRAGAYCVANTNGTLLDSAVADELVRLGVDDLRVTTMAGTDALYRATHPGCHPATFERLKENLLYLAARKASSGRSRPLVALVSIVTGANHEGLPDFVAFAKAVRADRVVLQPMDDVSDPNLTPLVLTDDQADRVRKDLASLSRELESDGIAHNFAQFSMVFGTKLDTRALYRAIPCYIGWLGVRFMVGGLAYPCHRCYEPIGNAYEQKFADLWSGAAYRRFRREARAINRRGTPVTGCACDSCCHFMMNLRVYRRLHPLKGWSARIQHAGLAAASEDDA